MTHLSSPELNQSPGQKFALVVDDNELVRGTTKMFLNALGYKTLEAPNGYEGVITYRAFQSLVAFVILDVEMPVMDGISALKDLLSINKNVNVIMATGALDEILFQRIKSLKDISILRKPFMISELESAISAFGRQ